MILSILLDIVIWSYLTDRKPTTEAQSIDCQSIPDPCINTTIKCDTNTNCSINCNSSSCSNSNIQCPISSDCKISCNGKSSCHNTIIFASKSSKLNISGCTHSLCHNLTIYCPPSTNTKNCFISGGDELGPGLSIYAIHGWDDIEIVGSSYVHGGDNYMLCGTDYDKSCSITNHMNQWKCVEYHNNDHCYDNFTDINDGFDIDTTQIIVFEHESVGKDPRGILWVGLFLVLLSLSWIVCAIIRFALKKAVHDKHLNGDQYGGSDTRDSYDQETSDGDTEEEDEDNIDHDGDINHTETETINTNNKHMKVQDMIQLQSFSDYTASKALDMNDVNGFAFERVND